MKDLEHERTSSAKVACNLETYPYSGFKDLSKQPKRPKLTRQIPTFGVGIGERLIVNKFQLTAEIKS